MADLSLAQILGSNRDPAAAIATVAMPPSGRRPLIVSTSSAARSSIGMAMPSASAQSIVEAGSAT